MRCVLQDDRVAVFDELLAPPDWERVWRFIQAQRYHGFHATGWDPVWPLHDGEPLGGPVVHSGHDERARQRAEATGAASAVHVYPTSTGIDRLIEELSLQLARLEPLIGVQGTAWTVFTARAFLYPAGTGLGWHTDSDVFTGAFSYYAHPEWNSRFGGELFVADTPPGWTADHGFGSPLDNRAESALLLEAGSGRYIHPKPNRLVVLKSGVLHRINPVHAAAGATVRCSIAGFFVREAAPEPR
jgi:hypothetical protein